MSRIATFVSAELNHRRAAVRKQCLAGIEAIEAMLRDPQADAVDKARALDALEALRRLLP